MASGRSLLPKLYLSYYIFLGLHAFRRLFFFPKRNFFSVGSKSERPCQGIRRKSIEKYETKRSVLNHYLCIADGFVRCIRERAGRTAS